MLRFGLRRARRSNAANKRTVTTHQVFTAGVSMLEKAGNDQQMSRVDARALLQHVLKVLLDVVTFNFCRLMEVNWL